MGCANCWSPRDSCMTPSEPPLHTAQLATDMGARYRAAKWEFLGVGLSCMSDLEFLDAVREAVTTRSRLVVSFINPDYVNRAHRIPGLREKINEFDIVLPDGWGVVL